MIRSDKDILTILNSALDACAIYDSPELHVSYASTKMLQLWNCDESVLGQQLEKCLAQQVLLVPKLKQVWETKKKLVRRKCAHST